MTPITENSLAPITSIFSKAKNMFSGASAKSRVLSGSTGGTVGNGPILKSTNQNKSITFGGLSDGVTNAPNLGHALHGKSY